MKNIKVCLNLDKVIPLSVEEDEDEKLKASRIVDEMIEIDKKNYSYLSAFEINESVFEGIEEESLIFTLVKKAIDSFDPYFVHPDSYDEYDGESRRIAEKIKKGMSIDEIAEIMKEEFNWSFSAKFTREDFYNTAETVSSLLENSSNKAYINEGKMTKRVYVYVKLSLSKIIQVKVLEKEDGESKALEIVFDKIDSDKESKSLLSSFNIADWWCYDPM